ncbi:unnamed protein product, partial [Rotaria sp. Silwood1]
MPLQFITNTGRRNRNDRRQQPPPPQQQQYYQKRIVVPVRGVSVTFCVTSTSPMMVQVVSPVPVKHTPVLGGVSGRLQLADGGGGGVGSGASSGVGGGVGGDIGGGVGGGSMVVKDEAEEFHDYSQFLIDNI